MAFRIYIANFKIRLWCYLIWLVLCVISIHVLYSRFLTNRQTILTIEEKDIFINEPLNTKNFKVKSHIDINALLFNNKIDFSNFNGGSWRQGFDLFPIEETEEMTILFCAFSHLDYGWIKTPETYYKMKVESIINNVIDAMEDNIDFKFNFIEISFLSMWWENASLLRKNKLTNFIEEGRLEIVNGGWIMPDEAITDYISLVNQLSLGHEWLKNNIPTHKTPKVSWNLDSFGGSSVWAHILQKSGIKNIASQRYHYAIKKHFALNQNMEFIWKPRYFNGAHTGLFTHVMPFYSYDIPHSCGPDTSICCQYDFERLVNNIKCPWVHKIDFSIDNGFDNNNMEEMSNNLLEQLLKKASLYQLGSKLLLVPWGDDFRYQTSIAIKAQIRGINMVSEYLKSKKSKIRIRWATISEYFDKLHQLMIDTQTPISTLTGDFFVYSDVNDAYWSGYFTSRPYQKQLHSIISHYIRGIEGLLCLSMFDSTKTTFLFKLTNHMKFSRDYNSAFLHHDSITGVSTNYVVRDYLKKFQLMIYNLEVVGSSLVISLFDKSLSLETIEELAERNIVNLNTPLHSYFSANLSFKLSPSHLIIENNQIFKSHVISEYPTHLVIKNTHSFEYTSVFNIVIHHSNVDLFLWENESFKKINSTLVIPKIHPYLNSSVWTNMPDLFELYFTLKMQPLEVKHILLKSSLKNQSINLNSTTFYFNLTNFHPNYQKFIDIQKLQPLKIQTGEQNTLKLRGKHNSLEIDLITGKPLRYFSENQNDSVNFTLDYSEYLNDITKSKSGAYLFHPINGSQTIFSTPDFIIIRQTSLFDEALIQINLNLAIRYRTYKVQCIESNSIMVDTLFDITPKKDIDFSLTINTGISIDNLTFFVDQNSFETVERRYNRNLPIQANVFPASSWTFIEDKKWRLSILYDQPHGVLLDGNGLVNVFLDRRISIDDQRGLNEPLMDNVPHCSRNYFIFENMNQYKSSEEDYKKQQPTLSLEAFKIHSTHKYPALIFFNLSSVSFDFLSTKQLNERINKEWPENLFLSTFRMSNQPTSRVITMYIYKPFLLLSKYIDKKISLQQYNIRELLILTINTNFKLSQCLLNGNFYKNLPYGDFSIDYNELICLKIELFD